MAAVFAALVCDEGKKIFTFLSIAAVIGYVCFALWYKGCSATDLLVETAQIRHLPGSHCGDFDYSYSHNNLVLTRIPVFV